MSKNDFDKIIIILKYIKRIFKMDIIKKLFCFNNDEEGAIGLCKFNDEFYKLAQSKSAFKDKVNKNATLTQMLKRSV